MYRWISSGLVAISATFRSGGVRSCSRDAKGRQLLTISSTSSRNAATVSGAKVSPSRLPPNKLSL